MEQTQRWQRCGFSRQIFKFFSGKYVQGFKGKDGHEHAQIGNLSRNGDLNKNQIEKNLEQKNSLSEMHNSLDTFNGKLEY